MQLIVMRLIRKQPLMQKSIMVFRFPKLEAVERGHDHVLR